jgi:hypothetical protein
VPMAKHQLVTVRRQAYQASPLLATLMVMPGSGGRSKGFEEFWKDLQEVVWYRLPPRSFGVPALHAISELAERFDCLLELATVEASTFSIGSRLHRRSGEERSGLPGVVRRAHRSRSGR